MLDRTRAESKTHKSRLTCSLFSRGRWNLRPEPCREENTHTVMRWSRVQQTSSGPDLTHHLFLYSLLPNNGFHTFKWLKTKLKDYNPWNWSDIQVSASINKVWLAHRLAHSLMYCLWLLSSRKGQGEWLWQRLPGLQNLKYSLSGPSQKKSAGPYARGNLGLGVGEHWVMVRGRSDAGYFRSGALEVFFEILDIWMRPP